MSCANPQIHLLGMSNNFVDDMACTSMPNVMGIDSANPMVMGYQGISIWDRVGIEHLPRGDYWECVTLNKCMEDNVDWMNDNCGI